MKPINTLLTLCLLLLLVGCQNPGDSTGEVVTTPNIPDTYYIHSDYKETSTEIPHGNTDFDILHQIAIHLDESIETSNVYETNVKVISNTVEDSLQVQLYVDIDDKLIYKLVEDKWQQVPTSTSDIFFTSEILMSAVTPVILSPALTIDTLEGTVAYEASSQLIYTFAPKSEVLTTFEGITPTITSEASTVYLDFSVLPTSKTLSMVNTLNGEVFYTGPMESNALLTPNVNGPYDIVVTASYDDSFYYKGDITYSFQVIYEHNPEVSIQFANGLNEATMKPGEMILMTLNHIDEPETVVVTSDIKSVHDIYQVNETLYAVIASKSSHEPGEYPITITYTQSGEEVTDTLNLVLDYKEFPVDYLYVTASTASIRSDDNAINDQPYFDAAWASQISQPLWDGPFIPPTEGVITTEYGIIRVTNDNWDNTRRHDALDIANKIGTPVYASNTGKVVLSHPLNITGNTLVIDHGLGLYSVYFHLNELFVTLDEYVEKGQYIADMGTTGYSTGSHLHFAIRHNGVYLDPNKFYEPGYLPNFSEEIQ